MLKGLIRIATGTYDRERELTAAITPAVESALPGVEVLAGLIVGHARRGGSIVLTSHQALPIHDPAPVTVQLHEPAFA